MAPGAALPVGDGAIARAFLDLLVDFLRNYAGPTGARGSILLMAGGLVVLGFLFMIFIFRSAVVGDLASTSNQRGRAPSALMPPRQAPLRIAVGATDAFGEGRQMARQATGGLDEMLGAMTGLGLGAPRILRARAENMHLRVYAEGDAGGATCEQVRGYLVGALESLLGAPVKVDESACRASGAAHCEFMVRHPRREVKA